MSYRGMKWRAERFTQSWYRLCREVSIHNSTMNYDIIILYTCTQLLKNNVLVGSIPNRLTAVLMVCLRCNVGGIGSGDLKGVEEAT